MSRCESSSRCVPSGTSSGRWTRAATGSCRDASTALPNVPSSRAGSISRNRPKGGPSISSSAKPIVTALEGYVADNDWEQPDWRGVERVLRQARAEWRQYHPVDRKSGRELTAHFEQLADDIHGRLKLEWERNIALKEEIVAQAMQVRESGDRVTDQAESMKALQRRWKSVGPLPRRADQRLWKQFREQCDAVFEARTVVRDRHVQRQQTIADAEALITELERRVEIDPSLDRNMIADYERRLHDLGTIPKELARRADEILRDADRIVVSRQSREGGRMSELWRRTAVELASLIRDGEVSSREVVKAHLDRIEEVNPIVNAVTVPLAESALEAAAAADAQPARQPRAAARRALHHQGEHRLRRLADHERRTGPGKPPARA